MRIISPLLLTLAASQAAIALPTELEENPVTAEVVVTDQDNTFEMRKSLDASGHALAVLENRANTCQFMGKIARAVGNNRSK